MFPTIHTVELTKWPTQKCWTWQILANYTQTLTSWWSLSLTCPIMYRISLLFLIFHSLIQFNSWFTWQNFECFLQINLIICSPISIYWQLFILFKLFMNIRFQLFLFEVYFVKYYNYIIFEEPVWLFCFLNCIN